MWYRPNWKDTKNIARLVPQYAAPSCMSLLESQWTMKILLHCNFLSVPVKLKPIGTWHTDWKNLYTKKDKCNIKLRLDHTNILKLIIVLVEYKIRQIVRKSSIQMSISSILT